MLPSRIPQLLVNGSSGIAVGMATNIPPHNLREVIGAAVEVLDNPDATLDDLMRHVHGPDFPTKGIIMGRAGIRAAYATGRGKVTIARAPSLKSTDRTVSASSSTSCRIRSTRRCSSRTSPSRSG